MRRRKRQRLAAMVVASLMIVLVCLTLSVIPAISANESTPDEQNSTAVLESALVYYSPNFDEVEAEPEETGVVTTETLPEEDIAPDHPYAALNLTFEEKRAACLYGIQRGARRIFRGAGRCNSGCFEPLYARGILWYSF